MRNRPIVAIPNDVDPRLVAVLQQSLGFLHPLVVYPLILSEAGYGHVPAALGTTLASSRHLVDWVDAGCNEFRLIGRAVDAGSVNAYAVYKVNGTEVARATLPQGAAATFAGEWTQVSPADLMAIGDDQEGLVTVFGNGAATVTWNHLAIQGRTLNRMW